MKVPTAFIAEAAIPTFSVEGLPPELWLSPFEISPSTGTSSCMFLQNNWVVYSKLPTINPKGNEFPVLQNTSSDIQWEIIIDAVIPIDVGPWEKKRKEEQEKEKDRKKEIIKEEREKKYIERRNLNNL